MTEINDEKIKAYALENAIKYKGKANQGAVLAGLFSEGLEKSQVKDHIPRIQKIIAEINELSEEGQKVELQNLGINTSKRKIREGLPELPNAKRGQVMMRFAPFPSGPLHIGNARTLILNDEYAKMYDGKLIFVMDDTIGSEAKPIEPEAYDLIKEGADFLEINYDKKIIYKSDRIEKYYDYAEKLLDKGYLYVCDCSAEERQKNKIEGKECSCRQFNAEEQLKRWKEMFKAEVGSMCVRLKTDMQDPDPAFRDRIMFRISDRPHAKLGKKFRVYPLLDFSWAIDDHELGITHIVRGMELAIETRVEKFIWDIFEWPHAEVVYNGHFAIEGIKISKSKGAQEVKSGQYIGWNDPRMWSIQSLRDRGITAEAIRQFVLNMGINKTSIKVPVEVLYSLNKKIVEESPRYFFIQDPKKIKIKGCPKIKAKIPRHPNGTLGYKEYETNQEFLIASKDLNHMKSEYYRLMHLLNFESDDVGRILAHNFSFISEDPDPGLEAKYIHWLPANADNIEIEILMDDGSTIKGLGEPELKTLKAGTIVQFERFGFVRLYKKHKDKLEFWFAHK